MAWMQVLAFLIPTWIVLEWLKAGAKIFCCLHLSVCVAEEQAWEVLSPSLLLSRKPLQPVKVKNAHGCHPAFDSF